MYQHMYSVQPSWNVWFPSSVQLQQELICRQGLYDSWCAPNTTVLLSSFHAIFPCIFWKNLVVHKPCWLANVQADSTLSRLNVLRERIDATEALISIHLDSRRNDLVAFDLVSRVQITIAYLHLAFFPTVMIQDFLFW